MRSDRLHDSVRIQQAHHTHLVRTPPSYSLPLQLRGKVPDCAQQCLITYINQQFQCPCNGITALCQRYSSQGYTLGELAYICLQQYCEQTTRSESFAQYDICNTIRSAVPATHTVLTVPATTPSKSHTSKTGRIKSGLQTNTVHTIPPSSEITSHSGSRHPVSFSTATGRSISVSKAARGTGDFTGMSSLTRSPSSTSPVAAGTSPSARSHKITATEAAGISVAALAATALIVAAMYFFFCVRRRKPKEPENEMSSNFPNKTLAQPSSRLTIKPADNLRGVNRDTIQCWQQLANPATYQSSNNVSAFPGAKRIYEGSHALSHSVPASPVSMTPRTPIKARATSTATAMTIFEEEEEDIPPVPELKLLGLPPNPRSRQHSPPVPKVPLGGPSKGIGGNLGLPELRNSPLTLQIPKSATTPTVQAPPPVALSTFPNSTENLEQIEKRGSTASKSRSRDSSGSLLNYYASSEAGVVTPSEDEDSPVTTQLEIPKRRMKPPAIEITKPTYPGRITRRNSIGSDTSFESMDMDEPTPSLEDDKQLTPVLESPASPPPLQSTPISAIRYPQIPRSANDRSPVYEASLPNFTFSPKTPKPWNLRQMEHAHIPDQYHPRDWPLQTQVVPHRERNGSSKLGGSTLAAKRRGDTAAHHLELNLNKYGTAYTGTSVPHHSARNIRHESPLKGYERNSGRNPSRDVRYSERHSPAWHQLQQPPLKSPLWEPKLTPERRGDDLYLQVGVATPMSATFRR